MGADLHDVVELVSPVCALASNTPATWLRAHEVPLACGVGSDQEAFGRNPIERPGGNHGRAAAVRRLRPRGERALA